MVALNDESRAPAITGDDYIAPTSLPLGPEAVSFRVGVLGFLGASRALLLQTSHPLVAAGVAEHSDYASDPWSRLYRTFDTVLKLLYASPEVSRRQSARMENRHRPVVGTAADGRRYDARDRQLGVWVWGTLVETPLTIFERVHGRLQPRDRERYYQEALLFGEGCNLPRDVMPATLDEFEAYWDRVVEEELEATSDGKDIAHFTFEVPSPPVLGPIVGAVNRWTAAAWFPPRVRELYGLEWTDRQERWFRRSLRVLRVVDRALPTPLRFFPIRLVVDHDLLARLERRRARRRRPVRRSRAARTR